MISYSLECGQGHQFDSLFGSKEAFQKLQRAKVLACPQCGDGQITRNLSAPRLNSSRQKEKAIQELKQAEQQLTKREKDIGMIRDYIQQNFEDVGRNLPEVARSIHYGEAKERPVLGEVNKDELLDLQEEGITLTPLPAELLPRKPAKRIKQAE